MPGIARPLARFVTGVCALVSLSASATNATPSYADLKQACEANEPRACNQLGVMHEEGRGAQKHLRHAAGLYEKACTGGYPAACTNLGTLYARGGHGVEADPSRAAPLFESACNANHAEACLHLGALYVEGKGVPQDAVAGLGFFEQACKLGDKRGCVSNSTGGTSATPGSASGDFASGTSAEPASVSENQGARFHALLTFGVQFGGEALVETRWSNGETTQLNAGDGVSIAVGGLLEPYRGPIHTFQLQGTVGYNYTFTGADNGSAKMTHVPVELLAFYFHRPSGLRIGGGPLYQSSSTLVGTGALNGTVNFDNALGLVLQAEWLPTRFMSVYCRFTLIRHPLPGSSESVSGGGVGVGMGFILPGVD